MAGRALGQPLVLNWFMLWENRLHSGSLGSFKAGLRGASGGRVGEAGNGGDTAHDGLRLAVCSSHYTWGFELGAQKA